MKERKRQGSVMIASYDPGAGQQKAELRKSADLNDKGEHEFRGKREVAYHIEEKRAQRLDPEPVRTDDDSTIWVFYVPETPDTDPDPALKFQPVGIKAATREATSAKHEQAYVYVRGPIMSWEDAKDYAQYVHEKLRSIEGRTMRTRWVWFLRHCFSCSNQRDRAGNYRDAAWAFFATLFDNARIR
ncbi:hypothetical protein EBZ37_13220, partial [bacterium]|nr:hypothetical protein [bacterium]